MKTNIFLALTFLLLLSCNSSNKLKEHDRTTMAVDNKKEEAYAMPDFGDGLMQSPINIITSQAKQREHHIKFNFDAKIDKVENLGHTVQLDFRPGSVISMDGLHYELRQIHFHTPSEHMIDGVTYPMEMHVVNTLKDQKTNEATQFLVLAFLFKMGEPNKFIEEFINEIPGAANSEHDVPVNQVNISDFLPQLPDGELHEWYHYLGSLTTPPYTESVNWYVFKHIHTASEAEIQKINAIEGNNARHVHALNARTVEVEKSK